jgi:hypothetical protein
VETTTIDLKPFSTSGEMIILKANPGSYSFSPFDEYIALEYFTPTGLNEFDCRHKYMSNQGKDYSMGSMTPGIRVWHVDARLVKPASLYEGKYHYEDRDDLKTTNPLSESTYGVTLMMSNTYYKNGVDDTYISPLGEYYYDYNVLQLIRRSTDYTDKVPNKASNAFSAASLFTYGDTFSMADYNKQFVHSKNVDGHKTGLLNTQEELGFSFTINGCMEEFASITITKL